MQTLPPVAARRPHAIETRGDVREDPYFWLRDRDDPEVRAYLEAENAYTEAWMKGAPDLYDEIRRRVKETDMTAPVPWRGYHYYSRTEEGKQYSIHCRRAVAQASACDSEQVLIDGNLLAEGHAYFSLGGMALNPEHTLLAYSTDTNGDETYELRVKDLATGELLPDRVERTAGPVVFAEDGRTLYYTTLDAAHRADKVWRHTLVGQASACQDDVLIYDETDERFTVGIEKSKSRRFVFIELASHTTTEVRVIDDGGARVVLPRRQDIEYDVTHNGDYFWIRINDTGKTFRLVKAPVADPRPENFTEIIAVDPNVQIEAQDHYEGHLALQVRDHGQLKLRILRHTDGDQHVIEMDEAAYTVSPVPGPEFHSKTLRFQYTSLVTPLSVFDYDMDARTRVLRKEQEIPGGYDRSRFITERFEVGQASACQPVPVTVVRRRDVPLDGQAPALLYGYGSYGIPIDPAFNSDRLALLERGFVFAIAHIRGGGDLGKPWHDEGKLRKKQNTFRDFIAAAEALIARRYTSPRRLAIYGGSAGGLLIGAVLNLRPDLFAAAIAKVPFVDTLSTMMDSTLPLTIGEYEEWGNPDNPDDYAYIKSYSPYDNVAAKNYPALLVTAGLNDPRVSYWEPAKWVAKLRTLKTSDRPLLLKTNLGAGHFGASGRYERMKETAFEYAFLLRALNVQAG